MRLEEIRTVIEDSTEEDCNLLRGDAPTYVHRVNYGSRGGEDAIWGLDEHHSRAVYSPDIDVGLVWGMRLWEPSEPDWADPLSSSNKKVHSALIEVLCRGQPVDRVVYAIIDNGTGAVPWPTEHYRTGANAPGEPPEGPESLTVTAWEMALVELTNALGGGGTYSSPLEYARRAGITVA